MLDSAKDYFLNILLNYFTFYKVDLRHEEEIHSPSSAMYNAEENSPTVDVGIDLTEFYMSVEWDILEVSVMKT